MRTESLCSDASCSNDSVNMRGRTLNNTNRREFSRTGIACGAVIAGNSSLPRKAEANDAPAVDFEREVLQPSADSSQWPAFREALAKWREEAQIRIRYDDSLYHRREFA